MGSSRADLEAAYTRWTNRVTCPSCNPNEIWTRADAELKEMVLVGARWYCVEHGTEMLDWLEQHLKESNHAD